MEIAKASHGPITFISTTSRESSPEKNLKLRNLREDLAHQTEITGKFITKQGTPHHSIGLESQKGFYDLVIIGKESVSSPTVETQRLIRRILLASEVPVLAVPANIKRLKRILICTAAGEPGKIDVRFAARLARHTGSEATVFHVLSKNATIKDKTRAITHLEQACELLEGYKINSKMKITTNDFMTEALEEFRPR